LSFASNDSEEKLDWMNEWSLSTAKWQDKPAPNFVSICTVHTNTQTLWQRKNYWNQYQDWLCLELIQNENMQHWYLQDKF
jgi:hypothetical protein